MDDINCWQDKLVICSYAQDLLDKLIEVNSYVKYPVDIEQVKKGIYYAKKYHGDQMRQSGEPYYTHPIAVANMVAEYTVFEMPKFFRTDMIITALLHDTIEDTELTEAMIAKIFDEKIAGQVEDLTRVKEDKKINASETLNILYSQNKKDILIIKILDRLHNMQTLDSMPIKKINKIKDETLMNFLIFVQSLGMLNTEIILSTLCSNNELTRRNKGYSSFITDNSRLPFLTS